MGILPYGVDTATLPNHYAVIPSSGLGSGPPAAGDAVLVKIRSSGGMNTGASMLQVTYGMTTPSAPITLANGAQIPPGLLAAGQMVLFTYDGTNWQLAEATVASYLSVDQFGAVGDGTTPDDTAVGNADTAGTLVFNSGKTYALNSSHTFTSQAVFAPGSAIKVAMGQTVTFAVPPQAGPFFIFQGSGTVNVGGPVRVDWYGALANGTDDSSPIDLAAQQQEFIFSSGKTYTINTNPTFTNQAIFEAGAAISVGGGTLNTVQFIKVPIAGPYQIFKRPAMTPGNAEVFGPVLAEWYGATGDGSTNDAAFINLAWSQSPVVILSDRTYNIGTTTLQPLPLLMSGATTGQRRSLLGAGVDRTVIAASQTLSSNQDVISLYALDEAAVAESVYWEIGGFTLQNTAYPTWTHTPTSNVPTKGEAIVVNFSSYGHLHDVKILNFYGGVHFLAQQTSVIDRVTVYGCVDHSLLISDTYVALPSDDGTIGVLNLTVNDFYGLGNYLVSISGAATTQYCNYGVHITVYSSATFRDIHNVLQSSYNEGVQLYDCEMENHRQCLCVDGAGLDWRTGTSSELKFDSCTFDQIPNADMANATNSLSALFDSQFLSCYFGFSSSSYGLDLVNTDGLEFISCQVVFNIYHGVHITGPTGSVTGGLDGTVNCRWIGGAVRNNSWITYPLMYDGFVLDHSVSNLLIQGVLLGDYLPPKASTSIAHASPSQHYSIVMLTDGSGNFTGTNVLILNNILSVQIAVTVPPSTTQYGNFFYPPYPSNFTNYTSVIFLNNYGKYP